MFCQENSTEITWLVGISLNLIKSKVKIVTLKAFHHFFNTNRITNLHYKGWRVNRFETNHIEAYACTVE